MSTNRHQRLATAPIGRLLWLFSLPATIGMLVQAFYNIIDTIFIGHAVGTLGIAALSIVFPIQMLITAITQIISVGSGSLISILLGAKQQQRAEAIFGNAIVLAMAVAITITIAASIFSIPILRLFGATPAILPYAESFLKIVLLGVPFIMFAMITNNIVRSEGNPKVAMFTMLSSALINTILDPIFIFGFKLGVEGAAIATVIAQASIALFLLYYFVAQKSSLTLHLYNFALKITYLWKIVALGSASFTRIATAGITVIILNHLLGYYGGNTAIATYGILNRVLMFSLMPLIGISRGLQPIVGYNYGAKIINRVTTTIKLGVKVSTLVSIGSSLSMLLFMEPICRIFTTDLAIITLAKHAILFIAPTVSLLGFQVMNNNLFEALGKAKQALFISILRGVILLIPLLLIIPRFLHMNGIWLSFPIADLLSFTIITILFAAQMRNFKKKESKNA